MGGSGHQPASANSFLAMFPPLRLLQIGIAIAVSTLAFASNASNGIEGLLQQTHWGESSDELLQQYGNRAVRLSRALDFGDSYADVILHGQTLGDVPMVVFFQMDKTSHGFRAIAAALRAEYGKPDQICIIPVVPASGYQAATEERWAQGGTSISAIFRDTTLQAFEGCLFGPATGWCGLHGQILVRISPSDDAANPSLGTCAA